MFCLCSYQVTCFIVLHVVCAVLPGYDKCPFWFSSLCVFGFLYGCVRVFGNVRVARVTHSTGIHAFVPKLSLRFVKF